MKVLITKEQFRSIISEQKKEDPKPKIVGKDNMYNRLVKAFGSKNVPKPGTTEGYEEYRIVLPNKDEVWATYYEKWTMTYFPKKTIYPNTEEYQYFDSEGDIELIGDLDFKVTFYNNDGTYDSQTKKWNGSSDVKPLPKREDPKSIIQSNDTYRRIYNYYKNNVIVNNDFNEKGIKYGISVINFNGQSELGFWDNDGYFKENDNVDAISLDFEPIGNDDFKIKLENGRVFDSQTKKWTKGKPFKTVYIEGENMTEFASNLIKNTKNLKIDLDSMKIDVDNFKINFNTTEDGTQVYELYLSLNSSKNPYERPASILNNYPKSKIIGRGNFPNKPEYNYTLIAIII